MKKNIFIQQRMKELDIHTYISKELKGSAFSTLSIKKTPLGDKVIIYSYKASLIVGRKGEKIRSLTRVLKERYGLENPQIEVIEIKNPYLDPHSVAGKIVSTMERFGSKRFKLIAYKTLELIMKSGARGCEIVLSGKIPSSRAKAWRFRAGYLKKSGYVSQYLIGVAYDSALLKTGIVGVQVRILHPDTVLPDEVTIKPTNAPVQKEEKKEIIEVEADESQDEKKVEQIKQKHDIKEESKPISEDKKTKKNGTSKDKKGTGNK